MLEVEGAGLAAVRATPKQMNDLRAAFALLVARTRDMATSSHSEAQYHAADIGFHRTLAGASGNCALARLVHEIHRSTLPRQILARPDGRRVVILGEHERILRAVEAGDANEARAAMSAHLTAVQHYLAVYEARQRAKEFRSN